MLRVVCLAAACLGAALGQQVCTVEENPRASTITGRLSIGGASVALTLPYVLFRADPDVVYLQVSGEFPDGWLLESGAAKTAVRDGAALHLSPQRNARLAFSVVDADGRRLCEWVPRVGTSRANPPFVTEGFDRSNRAAQWMPCRPQFFRIAGDPLLLVVGGTLANESATFWTDGVEMPVLARNAHHVILRDPRPAAGLRTIESRGYSIALPFVVLQIEAVGTTLEIKVLGRERIPLPALPERRIALLNPAPGQIELACGRGRDPKLVSLAGKESELVASCKIRTLKPGTLDVTEVQAVYSEFGVCRWSLAR